MMKCDDLEITVEINLEISLLRRVLSDRHSLVSLSTIFRLLWLLDRSLVTSTAALRAQTGVSSSVQQGDAFSSNNFAILQRQACHLPGYLWRARARAPVSKQKRVSPTVAFS